MQDSPRREAPEKSNNWISKPQKIVRDARQNQRQSPSAVEVSRKTSGLRNAGFLTDRGDIKDTLEDTSHMHTKLITFLHQ